MSDWLKFFMGDDNALPEGFEESPTVDGEPVNPVTGATSTGCQHANIRTDGLSRWCEDCELADDA